MNVLTTRELKERLNELQGQTVMLQGWIRNHRKQKNMGFIDFFDGTCFKNPQVVYDNTIEDYAAIQALHVGAAITVTGKVVPSYKDPTTPEVQAIAIHLEGDCPEDYPLQPKRHSVEYLREIAYLRPRTRLFQAVFRVRSVASMAIHTYFQDRGYLYVHTPLITANDAEGAGNTFTVTTLPPSEQKDGSNDFFGKPTSLAVTGQLEAETFAMAFSKVYTFGPTFRAENSNTKTHAAEFWMIEPEIAFCDIHQLMDIEEDFLKYLVKTVLEKCSDELEFLDKFTGGGLLDNSGPWQVLTPWPNTWWNLNVQLSYWPVYASNRLELGMPVVDAINNNFENLINNVPEAYRKDAAALPVATDFNLVGVDVRVPGSKPFAQVGNLPWLCHNLWLQYRYSMDESILRNTVYPTLRRAINFYLPFLEEDGQGILHLKETYSPEYGNAKDCNYDLALLRWGCLTLLEACRILSINDELCPTWQHIADKLTDYPQNENGMMIGKDVPYSRSHRHFSHLLMFYPLHLLNAEQEGSKELLEKSVEHWHSLPDNILGFSYTGASLLYAAFGEGNKALEKLNGLFALTLRPNTMYMESGPVIETPLSGAQCVHEMLLQSWGKKIRVFPAVPSQWQDVRFQDLRAEGAFLVSAIRKGGKTTDIRIKSLAGEPCILQTDMENPVVKIGNAMLVPQGKGVYALDIRKGETVTITSQAAEASPIGPVEGKGGNFFGLP